MKISPVAPMPGNIHAGVETQPSRLSLKMNTNATPGPAGPQPPPELTIPDPNRPNEEATAVVEATQPLSPQLAALAKQRRAVQQERQALEREKAAFAESQGRDPAISLARLKSEPLSALLEAGVTYDQLTEAILANQGSSELNALKAEIAALKGDVDKKFTDRETQAEQQVLAEMQREAKSLIAQGDDYEMVRATGSLPKVMDLIVRTYRENGEVLDVREALKLVEDAVFEEHQKLTSVKKIQGLFTQAPTPPPAQPQRSPGMRTLTNKDTASVPLTAKARAVAAFYGTLKK